MLRIVLILLISLAAFFAAPGPARADMEGWLPDFGEWAEKGLKPFFDMITEKVKDFFTFMARAVESAAKALVDFFREIWQHVQSFFQGLIDLFEKFWQWIYDALVLIGEAYMKLVERLAEWGIALYWQHLKWKWEMYLIWADWILKLFVWILERVLNSLPPIELPAGFEEGLRYFVEFGMTLNKVLPFKEGLYLIGLFVSLWVMLTVFNYLKKFWSMINFWR